MFFGGFALVVRLIAANGRDTKNVCLFNAVLLYHKTDGFTAVTPAFFSYYRQAGSNQETHREDSQD